MKHRERTALARLNNPAAHSYFKDNLSGTHICRDCGVSEHRNGQFWLWGKWSMEEPPCRGNTIGQNEWHAAANEDKEDGQWQQSK